MKNKIIASTQKLVSYLTIGKGKAKRFTQQKPDLCLNLTNSLNTNKKSVGVIDYEAYFDDYCEELENRRIIKSK